MAPGPNGRLDTAPEYDDVVLGPDGILPGHDGAVQSVAQGDDVQLVPVGTTGVPEDRVVITAGRNAVLDTPVRGDDIAAVVTGYEVSTGPLSVTTLQSASCVQGNRFRAKRERVARLVDRFGAADECADVRAARRVLGPGAEKAASPALQRRACVPGVESHWQDQPRQAYGPMESSSQKGRF